jgi:fructose-bisphosphate aldolase class 1
MSQASYKEIQEKQEIFKKELDKVHKNLIKLTWYMRGGVTLSEIYEMPSNHIEFINEVVKDNIETSKKIKHPIF